MKKIVETKQKTVQKHSKQIQDKHLKYQTKQHFRIKNDNLMFTFSQLSMLKAMFVGLWSSTCSSPGTHDDGFPWV